jgi:hypothetical protein
VSIIDLMDDPKTFAPHFKGDTWDRWRVFLKALFGLPMTDAEREVYRHHTGRQTPPARPSLKHRSSAVAVVARAACWR